MYLLYGFYILLFIHTPLSIESAEEKNAAVDDSFISDRYDDHTTQKIIEKIIELFKKDYEMVCTSNPPSVLVISQTKSKKEALFVDSSGCMYILYPSDNALYPIAYTFGFRNAGNTLYPLILYNNGGLYRFVKNRKICASTYQSEYIAGGIDCDKVEIKSFLDNKVLVHSSTSVRLWDGKNEIWDLPLRGNEQVLEVATTTPTILKRLAVLTSRVSRNGEETYRISEWRKTGKMEQVFKCNRLPQIKHMYTEHLADRPLYFAYVNGSR